MIYLAVTTFYSCLCFPHVHPLTIDLNAKVRDYFVKMNITDPTPNEQAIARDLIFERHEAEEEARQQRERARGAEDAREKDQYLKFCDVAREEIDKLDEYAYDARDNNGNEFSYDMKLINGKQGYFEQQNERRRQRILFALEYSTHYNIQELKQKMGKIDNKVMADKISRAYGMLSKAVHEYVYTPGFHGTICYHITHDKSYNKYLNILLEDFDWEVGKIEYKTTKK